MTMRDEAMLELLTPACRAYVEQLRAEGGPALANMSLDEARTFMREMQDADVTPYPVEAVRHPVEDFSVVVLRPKACSGPLPVVLYLHGGGWVLGDAETHARMVREIALQSQAAIVFVEYSRAPESQFPLPLQQCYRALEWVAAQGASLDLDPSRIAVAGDSAGGNLAAALALLTQQRGGPALRLQALLYPVTSCDFDTGSYEAFSTGLNLDRETMRWFWDRYLPEPEKRSNPLASPLFAAPESLRALPPALIITAECDVLRDEGEAWGRRLAAAGVPVTSVRFTGTLHGFMMIDALARDPQSVSAMRLLASHLRDALRAGQEVES